MLSSAYLGWLKSSIRIEVIFSNRMSWIALASASRSPLRSKCGWILKLIVTKLFINIQYVAMWFYIIVLNAGRHNVLWWQCVYQCISCIFEWYLWWKQLLNNQNNSRIALDVWQTTCVNLHLQSMNNCMFIASIPLTVFIQWNWIE